MQYPQTALLYRHVLQKSPALPARPAMEAVAALKHSLPLDERLVDLSAVNWSMAFEPPANVTVGGSWPLASGVKWKGDAGWSVDVFVEMPSVSVASLGILPMAQ